MLAEYHYDQITAILKQRGMGHYGESHEGGRAFVGDGMEAKRTNDVPMSAMWTQRPGVNAEQHGYNADIRESASVAHLYGKTYVAAESLTAGSNAWAWSPATLKPTADKELAMGLNRFVIHTSVHQPLVDKGPGLSLGPFGQWFTRNETWAEQARAWVTYLARSSFMLQQGRFVADVLYYYGEDTNVTALFRDKAPPVPAGYNFDYVNADALVNLLSVADGQLAAPSGMRYRVLALDPNSRHMSLPVLRKIRDLVAAGAVVAGPKPLSTPSLSDDEAEFRRLADELWGPGTAGGGARTGKGTVSADGSLGDVLKQPGRAARLRAHEAAGRHRAARGAPLPRRRRSVLRQQPQRSRRRRRGHVPCERQGGRALARRHGHSRGGILQDRERAHDRAAAPRAVGCRVRRLSKARGSLGSGAAGLDRDDARDRRWGLGRSGSSRAEALRIASASIGSARGARAPTPA